MDGRQSALILPVPEAEPAVGEFRAAYDPVARAGVPAHVTLLYPFLPPARIDDGVLRRLRDLLAGAPTIAPLRFAVVGRFPGVLHLAPSAPEPIAAMTRRLVAEWPECPPYGGRFAEIVPHLTVAQHDDARLLDGIEASLGPRLPIEARGASAILITEDSEGNWRERERFTLR